MHLSRLLLLLALSLATGFALPAVGDDDDGVEAPREAAASSAKPVVSAVKSGAVHLTPEQQQAAGLVVEPLRAVTFRPEVLAFGKVLDIHPLLELRIRYRVARAEAEAAAAALALARKNRDRLSVLHRAEIVAGRELAQAEAQWQSDRARSEAAGRLPEEIRREAEHGFGIPLAHLALDGEAALFDDLAAHRRYLLRIALPAGYSLPSHDTALFIAREHDRAHAAEARLISPAPTADELVQGETWFFHTAAAGLRAGMRVNAWVPLSGEKQDGVAIPLSAVVWHAGKPWVYWRTGDADFTRREVTGYREYGGGWFVEQGFGAGEGIVVTGGQTLLSEEFRSRIPDEDDD